MADQCHDAESLTILLEIVPADASNPDPAALGDVARDTVDSLRQAGYDVKPAYTGTRGGNVFEIIRELAQHVQDNKELLTALFGTAVPIVQYLFKEHPGPPLLESVLGRNPCYRF